jgi:COMPASS component SWD3
MTSDATLRISNKTTGVVEYILSGHTSRIWDCASSPTFDSIASASGDGTIRIWSPTGESKGVLHGDGGDVYSLSWRPSGVRPLPSLLPLQCEEVTDE